MFKTHFKSRRLYSMVFGFFYVIAITLFVSGCGNKGDLYLPEKGSSDKATTNPVKKKS